MQLDDVARLRFQSDQVDPPRQALQLRIRTGRFPERIHHRESIFVAVGVERLKPLTSTRLEVGDPRISSRFDGRQKIPGENAGVIHGLESITEGCTHEVYFFAHAQFLLFRQFILSNFPDKN